MAPRQARSSVAQPTKRTSAKKNRKRHLDAFAIAGKLAPEKTNIRKHRFGVTEENGSTTKRRRAEDSDEDADEPADDERSRPDKRRRSQAQDEDVEYGSDSEGNEWTIGGVVDDDDDESLDSDEAFGESDEEKFEGFTFRGSSNNKKKPQRSKQSRPVSDHDELDLDEAESEDLDEDEDGFGDEGVDLATMLDDDQEEEEEEEESQDRMSDDQSSEDEVDEESDDEERHARLQDFVEGLDNKSKAKALSEVADGAGEALTLDDLLEDADLDSKTLATLKPRKKTQSAQLVTAALPKRQQDAIDRKLATEKAKEQLDRWRDTVIQNRRADFLSFPLRNPDEAEPASKDTFTPAQQTAPNTELEANIRQIMEESGMIVKPRGGGEVDEGDDDLLKAEELATNKLPVDQVLARRAELRRQRELLFREEIKAKRIAKIKSKSYRRVHRKERERQADKERMLLDPEGFANGDLDDDEQELADRARAEARMSAKHKDSKWARSLRATDRTVWDDDARAGVIEAARRQEELKRRIAGRDASDVSDNDDDEYDEPGTTSEQLKKLATSQSSGEKRGLAAMDFMQRAENRRKAANDAAINEMQRDLDPSLAEEDSGIEDNGLGRAIFGPRSTIAKAPKQVQKRPELEEGPASDSDDVEEEQQAAATAAEKANPAKSKASKAGKQKNGSGPLASSAVAPERDAKETRATSAWLTAPREKKSKLDRKLARSNDEAIIDTRITDNVQRAQKSKSIPAEDMHQEEVGNTEGWTAVSYKESAPDAEDDTEAPMLSKAERNAAFHARAFAGDDVALQFTDEKDALVASEDEKETSTHMPGWGSWAGAGLTKGARKAAERARHNPLYKTKLAGTRPQDRQDAKLANVIISEKSDRKGKKYLAPILPHQYERKDEYERSLRMPIGPEWTTKEVFQKSTRPRVVVKPGVIIDPISRPLL